MLDWLYWIATLLSYLAIALAVLVFWIYQFVQLMLLSDSDFPGKYDKILWVVVFILAFLPAPFAFFGWKIAYRSLREAEKTNAEAD